MRFDARTDMLGSGLRVASWCAFLCATEATLLDRWYHIGLRKLAFVGELAINYVLYGLAALMAFRLVLRLAPSLRLARPGGRGALSPAAEALTVGAFVAAVAGHYLLTFPLAGSRYAALGAVASLLVGSAVGLAVFRTPPGRRGLVPCALALTLAGWMAWPSASRWVRGLERGSADGSDRVSILLILTDTLRADFLSCYGQPLPTSPIVDSLAASGARFTQAVSTASWTLPATASLLTGLFPSSHGATAYGTRITDGAPRLASLLAREGYRTAAFTENQFVTPRFGFGPGFDEFWTSWLPWVSADTFLFRVVRKLHLPLVEFIAKKEYPATLEDPRDLNWDALETAGHVRSWIGRAGREPFFLYVHFMGGHGPYGAPLDLLPGPKPTKRMADHPRNKGGGYPIAAAGDSVSAEELAFIERTYASNVRYVDAAVGVILDALRDAGRLDHTLVLFTADHGEEFYDHKGWNHGGSAFEEIVHVPLVVSGRDLVPAPIDIDARARLVDVMPTVLEAAGAAVPANLPGRSLAPLLRGDGWEAPPAFIEGCVHHPPGFEIDALIEGRMKLVRIRHDGRDTPFLYDLARDPHERWDVGDARPARRDSLLRTLLAWKQVSEQAAPAAQGTRLDPETEARLRALGYIQ